MKIKGTDLDLPRVSIGCMRIADKSRDEVYQLIQTALDLGINYFDHADIYGGGKCEELFGQVLANHPGLRERLIIQTKCGIDPGVCFNFSKEYILACVDRSLRRLQIDYIDILLFHRFDTLVDLEEFNEAIEELKASGKVRYFGLSNATSMQMAMVDKFVTEKMYFNQIELSLLHSNIIDNGFYTNLTGNLAANTTGGLLEYARINDVNLQAWSPIRADLSSPTFLDNPDYPELNKKLQLLADKYKVGKSAIAIAWINTHPANIITILGTTSPKRLREMAQGANLKLTREEWYDLYATYHPLP